MGIKVKCDWCNKEKELEHMGRYNKSGYHFCDQVCQNNHRRGFALDLKVKKEVMTLKAEGWTVNEIKDFTGLSSHAYSIVINL